MTGSVMDRALPSRGDGSGTAATLLALGVALLGLVSFALLVAKCFPYVIDDAFISFRYADNLASGHGLVFNPGEMPRSEGLTSPLYALLLAAITTLGGDIVLAAKWLGVLSTLGTAVLIGLVVRAVTGSCSTAPFSSSLPLGVGAAACFLSDPYVVANSVSGMETALSALAFAVFLYLLWFAQSPGGKPLRAATVGTGVAATIVPMLRPEMALVVALLFVVIGLLRRESRPGILVAFVTFVASGAVYYAARYSYYGLPFPLPFYVKQGGGLYSVEYFWSYVTHAIFPIVFTLAGAIAVLIAGGTRLSRRLYFVAALGVGIVIQLAYYATIRPIMGLGLRYFQPVTPGLLALGFIGLSEVFRLVAPARPGGATVRQTALMVGVVLAAGWNLSSYGVVKSELLGRYTVLQQNVIRVALAMRDAADGANLTIAMNDVGAVPFYTKFDTVDLGGLNDRVIALGSSTAATKVQLTIRQPDVVVLISTGRDPNTIRGWERLKDADVRQLGYSYRGTVPVDTHYENVVYTKGHRADGFVANLRAAGTMR